MSMEMPGVPTPSPEKKQEVLGTPIDIAGKNYFKAQTSDGQWIYIDDEGKKSIDISGETYFTTKTPDGKQVILDAAGKVVIGAHEEFSNVTELDGRIYGTIQKEGSEDVFIDESGEPIIDNPELVQKIKDAMIKI